MDQLVDLVQQLEPEVAPPSPDAWARQRDALLHSMGASLEVPTPRHPWRSKRSGWIVALGGAAAAAAIIATVVIPGSSTNTQQDRYPLSKLLAIVKPSVHFTSSQQQTLKNAVSAAPTGSAILSDLRSSNVQVSVNGSNLPLDRIALHTLGYDQAAIGTAAANAIRDGLNVQVAVSEVSSPEFCLKKGVAIAVLDQELVDYAKAHDAYVSFAKAEAFAQSQYQTYESQLGKPGGTTLGVTAQRGFLSAKAIASDQRSLTITAEMTAIAGPSSGDRTPALARWLKEYMTTHPVTIVGIPGLTGADVVAALPTGL